MCCSNRVCRVIAIFITLLSTIMLVLLCDITQLKVEAISANVFEWVWWIFGVISIPMEIVLTSFVKREYILFIPLTYVLSLGLWSHFAWWQSSFLTAKAVLYLIVFITEWIKRKFTRAKKK